MASRRHRRPSAITFAIAGLVCLSITLASPPAAGQTQSAPSSDELGKLLGTAPPAGSAPTPKAPPPNNPADGTIRVPITVAAGQSAILRAGASSLPPPKDGAALAFSVTAKPDCGKAWAVEKGVIVKPGNECAGRTIDLSYEVSNPVEKDSDRKSAKVEVRALVLNGVPSCGIASAPYSLIAVPAGTISLDQTPRQLADIVGLAGKKQITVDAFCISQEAIPASEVEIFLAEQALAKKQKMFPEILYSAPGAATQGAVATGGNLPYLGVSHRLAIAYAQSTSEALGRTFSLPSIDQYVAAAVHLLTNEPKSPSTEAFLVSLRAGLMEWTKEPCGRAQESFATIGARQHQGGLGRFCYSNAQRLGRMSFRLVTAAETAEK